MKSSKYQEEIMISHETVQEAVQAFLKRGGKIKVLPREEHAPEQIVGGDHWGTYEPLNRMDFP